jgi:murein DD-endopeptidase MepM/ murein hydrolase activator NlpD
VLGLVALVSIVSVAATGSWPSAATEPTGMVAGAVDLAAAPTRAPAPLLSETPVPTGPSDVAARGVTTPLLPSIDDPTDALPAGAPPIASLSGYRWPLAKARITLPFGPSPWGSRIVEGERFHDGIDLATRCGDRIVAAHDGTVLAAGRRYDDEVGWIGDLTAYYQRLDAKELWSTLPIVVVIDDGNGYRSIYAHFDRVVVKPGQTIRAGALLGYEGRTGRASGCHLHYGLFSPSTRATFAIDPAVVKRMKVPGLEVARIDPLLVLPARPPGAAASASPAR